MKLNKITRQVYVLNTITGLLLATCIFLPTWAELQFWTAVFFCLLLLYYYRKHQKKLDFGRVKNKASISYAVIFTLFSLVWNAFQFRIDDTLKNWFIIITIAILLALILTKILEQEDELKAFTTFLYLGLTVPFCYGTFIYLNCQYDTSEPKIHSAKIFRKSTGNGRYGKTYHLTIEGWNTNYSRIKTNVSRAFYHNHQTGENITVGIYDGKFGVSWYQIYQ